MSDSSAKIVRDLFMQGKTIAETVEHLESIGMPRTYISCVGVLKRVGYAFGKAIDLERPWSSDEVELLQSYIDKGASAESMRKRLYRSKKNVLLKIEELHPGSVVITDIPVEEVQENMNLRVTSMPWGPATKRGYVCWEDIGARR